MKCAVCTFIGVPIAAIAGNAQVQWLEAIEARLAITAMWLRDIKALRMAGLAEHSATLVADLRSSEITSSLRYRIFSIVLNFGSAQPIFKRCDAKTDSRSNHVVHDHPALGFRILRSPCQVQ